MNSSPAPRGAGTRALACQGFIFDGANPIRMTFGAAFNPLPKLPWQESFLLAGAACEISTNSSDLLELLRTNFQADEEGLRQPDFRMRFWVDPAAEGRPGPSPPYLRGLGHLVFAGFDQQNALLIDLRGRRAMGRFSPQTAADQSYWKRMILPLVLGVAGGSVGITALHCGCVAKDGNGLILAGGSGAGKSTLSLALAQRGFAFLSDEWTYFSRRNGQVQAWSLSNPLKLLPDAAGFFPELAALEPTVAMNGEMAFEIDPAKVFGVRRAVRCEPRWLVLLERQERAGLRLTEIPPPEATARFEEGLLAEDPVAIDSQRQTIRSLLGLPCALARYGGNPQTVALALEQFCESG